MNNYFTFLNSSIGKKILMSISGIFISLFLIFHLINNMMLFAGADTFNSLVESLESIKPIIRIMEVTLLVIFLTHIINGIKLTIDNRRATPVKYLMSDGTQNSSIYSKTMIISGIIILLFLIIHLKYFWYTYQIHQFIGEEKYFDVILRSNLGFLNNTPTAIFYIIAIIFIGSHLKHGFQSSIKTLGLYGNKNKSFINFLGIILWFIIPVLFISIIIAIQMGIIN